MKIRSLLLVMPVLAGVLLGCGSKEPAESEKATATTNAPAGSPASNPNFRNLPKEQQDQILNQAGAGGGQ